jgi:hypothetical protein
MRINQKRFQIGSHVNTALCLAYPFLPQRAVFAKLFKDPPLLSSHRFLGFVDLAIVDTLSS